MLEPRPCGRLHRLERASQRALGARFQPGRGESPERTGIARERQPLLRQTACSLWRRHERDAQCLNFLRKIDPAAAGHAGAG
jgi:hypothetical protein